MRLDVAVEVIADKIVVSMLEDCVDEGREVALVAEGALLDRLEDFPQIGIDLVLAVVVCVAEVFDILSQITEEEDVALPDLAGNLNLHFVSNLST